MQNNLVYDIRSSENALSTLFNLTGIIPSIWIRGLKNIDKYRNNCDLIKDVIKKHGHFPRDYENWQFVFFHITTSENNCFSFKKNGILDLKKSYSCYNSELRIFLDKKGIKIDLETKKLKYNQKTYDISFGKCPDNLNSDIYNCWCIGRKFFYDYTICGFLSIWDTSPYKGYVHCRPEILSNIDKLLGLNLSQDWYKSHKPYEVVAIVKGSDIIYDGDDGLTSREKTLNYLTKAFDTAFGSTTEEILLLKNNIQVPPDNIKQINPLSYWMR